LNDQIQLHRSLDALGRPPNLECENTGQPTVLTGESQCEGPRPPQAPLSDAGGAALAALGANGGQFGGRGEGRSHRTNLLKRIEKLDATSPRPRPNWSEGSQPAPDRRAC
jgi:hypothetical protein